MQHQILLVLASLLVCSCGQNIATNQQEELPKNTVPKKVINTTQYPNLLQKALEAHGGLDTWRSYASLKYDKVSAEGSSENQLINLYNRKVLISRETVQIGFNGEQVWVSPNLAAYGKGSARFYHNLHFYFFGIPFLLADPGINYEDQGEVMIDSVSYKALKITYNEGIGDSDGDVYIAHFDPETYQLKLLLYTVTYYGDNGAASFNALKYEEWQKIDGLLVPKTYVGYVYENGSLGKQRYSATFNNISFMEEAPDESLFEIPEVAEIDSLQAE